MSYVASCFIVLTVATTHAGDCIVPLFVQWTASCPSPKAGLRDAYKLGRPSRCLQLPCDAIVYLNWWRSNSRLCFPGPYQSFLRLRWSPVCKGCLSVQCHNVARNPISLPKATSITYSRMDKTLASKMVFDW